MTSLEGKAVTMGQVLPAALELFLVWDAFRWFLGVKPWFPWQLKARLGAKPSDLVLLDVGTPGKIIGFTCPGPKTSPMCLRVAAKIPPGSPSQEVVVICMTGPRSPLVAYALKNRGYARVNNLTGGMVGWKMYEWVSLLRGNKEPPNTRQSRWIIQPDRSPGPVKPSRRVCWRWQKVKLLPGLSALIF